MRAWEPLNSHIDCVQVERREQAVGLAFTHITFSSLI